MQGSHGTWHARVLWLEEKYYDVRFIPFFIVMQERQLSSFRERTSARLFHVMETTTPAYYFVNGCSSYMCWRRWRRYRLPSHTCVSYQLPHSNGNTHINIKVEKPCIENGGMSGLKLPLILLHHRSFKLV